MPSTEPCPFSALTLNGLRLKVRLGCGEEERQIPQFVKFDIRVRFRQLPSGCTSDQLTDTVCYSQVSDKLSEICNRTEYLLIEKLGWDAYQALKEMIPPSVDLWVRLTKEKPPIPYPLEQGASFCVGDWTDF